jgi:citrate lyase subunit beta/citryl-CoA lyase
VCATLERGELAGAQVAVRVNAIESPWFADDVSLLVSRAGAAIGSLVVPKVEGPEDVMRVAELLDSLGQAAARLGVQALLETARGLLAAGAIASASPRLEALILGYADLAASLGRPPDADRPELWLHAQDTVLVAARAFGLQAIDGPYLAIRDDQGLRERTERVRALGYDGKWAVHPGQLEAINAAFTPPAEELERARAIVAALEQAAGDEGRGALELDGEMIDEASRKMALQTVARGRAAGLA